MTKARPKDTQPAKFIGDTGPTRDIERPPTADELRRVMSALGKLGGRRGGKARAEKLSQKRRSEIARLAATARWSGDKDKE